MTYIKLHTQVRKGNFSFAGNCEINSRITGVFGPSGAGKTTLMHLLSGLEKPLKGFLQINSMVCFDTTSKIFVPAYKRRVGYVFQEGRIFPHLTVEQNLKYGWKRKTHSQKYFNEVIDLLQLRTLLKNRPDQLSGGQNQRVAIGRVLMSDIQLLLLDEPFTSLDPEIKKQAISLINIVIQNLKIPVLIVTHELKDLLMLTNDLLLIKDGLFESPESYLELIRRKKIPDFDSGSTNYYNIFSGKVIETLPEKGISRVQMDENKSLLFCIENDELLFRRGDPVKILLRGSDIALALNHIEEISIRNQFRGKVETIFQQHNHLICIVDCGIRIVTRITLDSGKTLKLKPGLNVWCLFKSLAVEAFK